MATAQYFAEGWSLEWLLRQGVPRMAVLAESERALAELADRIRCSTHIRKYESSSEQSNSEPLPAIRSMKP
jgi:hypothetical protein